MKNIMNIQKGIINSAVAVLMVAAVFMPAFSAQAYDSTYSGSNDSSYDSSYTPSSSGVGDFSGGCCSTGSYDSTYTGSYDSTYTGSYDSTYTPSYDSTYTGSYDSTYTPSYDSTYTGSYDSTYTPSYDSTYTPSYSSYYDSSYTPTTYTITNYGGCTFNCGGHGGGCYGNCGGYTPKPAPTCTITVSPTAVTPGQSALVSWVSSNATQGNIQNLGTNLPMSGSHTVYPTQTTTYTGTFTGAGGTVTCSGTVVVNQPQCPAGYIGTYPNCVPPQPAPTCSIIISNYNNYNGYYTPNQPITLTWTSANAQSGWINNGMGSVALNGSRVVYPTQNTTYTGTFMGYNGQTVNCSVTVNTNSYVPPVTPVYPTTPYVTLSEVPYTGLDLGPIGTVVYWAFLVLWCLVAAYLIVVKRVQNKIAASIKKFLFGSAAPIVASQAHAVTAEHSAVVNTVHALVSGPSHAAHVEVAGEDEFLKAQINRARI